MGLNQVINIGNLFLISHIQWHQLQPSTHQKQTNYTFTWYPTHNNTTALVDYCNTFCCIIACSHRRHRQDKTVLSCPRRRCKHNCRKDKTVLSCLNPVSNFQVFSTPQYIWDWRVANWKLGPDETKLSCLVTNSVHTTDMDKTRQDSLVLSCPCRRYEQAITDNLNPFTADPMKALHFAILV